MKVYAHHLLLCFDPAIIPCTRTYYTLLRHQNEQRTSHYTRYTSRITIKMTKQPSSQNAKTSRTATTQKTKNSLTPQVPGRGLVKLHNILISVI